MKLPKHINLSIEHNPHKPSYLTVEEWGKCIEIDWISTEEEILAKKNDEMWTIHWHPNNLVGSYSESAFDLQELLSYVEDVYC
jgi:hypothetical protein